MNALGDGDDLFRASVIGASEVAALFNQSPYLTKFELFHRKAGNIDVPEFGTDERQEAGVRLEPVIIEWACDKWGYKPGRTPKRLQFGHLGGHPDKVVTCPERGRGILEIKTADWLVAKKWGEEPPLNYQLQAITYAGLAGVDWADIIMLVGGNELRRFQIEARPKLFKEICLRVERFWRDIEAGKAPPADFSRDGAVLAELYAETDGETIDLKGDNFAAVKADEYLTAKAEEQAAKLRADAAKAELIEKLGHAAIGLVDGFVIKATEVKGVPDREAKAGEIIKGRKPYRRFSIKETNNGEQS